MNRTFHLYAPSPDPKAANTSKAGVDIVPYGDAMGYWRRHSPYYNDTHRAFREALRRFIDR